MVLDLRVKAYVWAPTPAQRRNLCLGKADDSSTGSEAPSHHSRRIGGRSRAPSAWPLLDQCEFESWEDLERYLGEYSKRTYQSSLQIFRVKTNNTITTRNNKIWSSGSKHPLLPNEWKNYGKTFTCTHGGTYKSRGKGKRKRIQSRTMECEAQINDCVQVDDDKVPTFILHITFALLVHNHSLDKRTYNQYPYVRTALESEVVTTVNEKRLKWDPKARAGVFMGYEEVSKAYRVYDIEAGQ
ncbi:hypothetical protein F443_17383, partial [Phytophthora nicotianae P1569]